jgi:hypothetical protein
MEDVAFGVFEGFPFKKKVVIGTRDGVFPNIKVGKELHEFEFEDAYKARKKLKDLARAAGVVPGLLGIFHNNRLVF